MGGHGHGSHRLPRLCATWGKLLAVSMTSCVVTFTVPFVYVCRWPLGWSAGDFAAALCATLRRARVCPVSPLRAGKLEAIWSASECRPRAGVRFRYDVLFSDRMHFSHA